MHTSWIIIPKALCVLSSSSESETISFLPSTVYNILTMRRYRVLSGVFHSKLPLHALCGEDRRSYRKFLLRFKDIKDYYGHYNVFYSSSAVSWWVSYSRSVSAPHSDHTTLQRYAPRKLESIFTSTGITRSDLVLQSQCAYSSVFPLSQLKLLV